MKEGRRRRRRDESISPRRSQSRGPLIIQRDQTLALARYPHPPLPLWNLRNGCSFRVHTGRLRRDSFANSDEEANPSGILHNGEIYWVLKLDIDDEVHKDIN